MVHEEGCPCSENRDYGALDWFCGGTEHNYCTLKQCMDGDAIWAPSLLFSDAMVAIPYLLVGCLAIYRLRRSEHPPVVVAAAVLFFMVFVLCGVSGYVLDIVRYWYPVYRLKVLLNMVLAAFTWGFLFTMATTPILGHLMGLVEESKQTTMAIEKAAGSCHNSPKTGGPDVKHSD